MNININNQININNNLKIPVPFSPKHINTKISHNDKVDMNIYNSTKNVNLNTIISYIKDGEVHSFMDNYDEEGLKKQEKLN